MKLFLWISFGTICIAGVILLWVWQFQEPPPQPPLKTSFLENGALYVENIRGVQRLKLFDSKKTLIMILKPFGRSTLHIRFPWNPGEHYSLLTDDGRSLGVTAPAEVAEFVLRVHAPLGQTPKEYYFRRPYPRHRPIKLFLPASPDSSVDLMLEVEKLSENGGLRFDLTNNFEQISELDCQGDFTAKGARLMFEFDKKIWVSNIKINRFLPSQALIFTLKNNDIQIPISLQIIHQNMNADSIQVKDWTLPTDEAGIYTEQHSEDQIVMPNLTWNRMASWFNIRPVEVNFFKAFTFQSISISNQTGQPISLLLKSEILDPITKRPIEFFSPPDVEATGGTRNIIGFTNILPNETKRSVLPIFVSPDTKAGSYLRRISITPMGSNKTLKVLEAPLSIVRSNHFYTAWTLGVGVLSFTWLIIVCMVYRRLVNSMGVRILVLLSLLGALQFSLAFISSIISSITFALLGPFNCLIGGLLSEVMVYLIITAILFLVPRVGAMTIAGLVSYIMGGIMFGSFGVTDILFTGSSIAFRELLLFLFGVTKFKSRHVHLPRLLPLILALGLADAASTYTSLILHSVFYRLFFADWYFILQVGITGFVYTAFGVIMGQSLGKNLRKVHA